MKTIALVIGLIVANVIVAQTPGNALLDKTGVPFTGEYTAYYESGVVQVSAQISEGLLEGVYKEYNEDGTIKELRNYSLGLANGTWVQYNKSGKMAAMANFTDGQKSGTWIVWDDAGNQQVSMRYENGHRVHCFGYDNIGAVIAER